MVLLWSMAVGSLSGVTNLALHTIGIAVLLALFPSLWRDLEHRLAGHQGAMR